MSVPAKLPLDGAQWARLRNLIAAEVYDLRMEATVIEIKDIREAVDRGIAKVFERPKPRLLVTDEALTALVDVVARAAGGGYCIESGRNPRMAALTALCGSLDIAEVNSVD